MIIENGIVPGKKQVSKKKSDKRKPSKTLLIVKSGLFIMLILPFLFYLGSFNTSFRSSSADMGFAPENTQILAGETYEQPVKFLKDMEKISSFEVFFTHYLWDDYSTQTSRIRVSLLDGGRKVIFTQDVVVNTIKQNSFLRFTLAEPVETVKAGTVFYISVEGIDTTEYNAPAVWAPSADNVQSSYADFGAATKEGGERQSDITGCIGAAVSGVTYDRLNLGIVICLYALIGAALFVPFRRPALKNRAADIAINTSIGGIALAGSLYLVKTFMLFENIYKNIWPDLLTLTAFLLLYIAVTFAAGRPLWGLVTCQVLMFVFALIEFFKLRIRGDAFIPTDFFASSEALGIVFGPNFVFRIRNELLIVFYALILIAHIVHKLMTKTLPRSSVRILTSIGASVLLVISFPLVYTNHAFLSERAGITNLNWAPSVNASVNGFFMSFLMNSDVLSMDAPSAYSEKMIDETILNSALTVKVDTPEETPGTGQKPDNIIFIMNESFYDLRELDDSFRDIDVMPYFDSLKSESESGFIVVPILGGGTCNTEFEVLTGFSDYFYQAGAFPYQQYVHQNTVSLATVLKADGYSAEAIHPNNPTFWNRDKVYKYFGFDTFISENAFAVEDRNRDWTTDRAVYDVIINRIQEEEGPTFTFAVTIQNHLPYTTTGTEAVYGLHSDAYNSTELDNYMNLIRQSDEELKYLIESLRSSDEKTVVVFFGDHAPALGNDFYDGVAGRELEKYSTPYLIWANYDAGLTPGENTISANYLGGFVLKQIGTDAGPWFTYTDRLREVIPCFSQAGVVDAEGNTYSSAKEVAGSSLTGYVDEYRAFQYDLLMKNKYFLQYYGGE